jgi:osmoprotectant transport system ATP-binding protein
LIALENVSKTYGSRTALHPATIGFPRSRTTVLIGPSGCGKSTLLRMIVGLVRPDTGRVVVGGETLTAASLERVRHAAGYMIQDGGLFPHLTARDNVTLLARHLRRGTDAIEARVQDLCALAGIPADTLARYPQQLSGGQRQRVGLMRALMLDPPLLLLDEPLGALDPVTRYELQAELKSIFARLAKTVVMVTHDMGEAAYFADELILMREGRVVQRGALEDLSARPADPYVGEFMRAQRAPTAPVP